MAPHEAAAVKVTTAVDLHGLVLSTPVMIAAGCAGTGPELPELVDLRKVGAVVSRSVTVDPREGSSAPRIAESPAGIVWDTGLQNPGLEAFISDELPLLARGVPALVSVAGDTLEDYVRLTSVLQGNPNASAIEVYLSGPDQELDRPVLGHHADRVNEIVGAVARMSRLPVYAKLPSGGDTVELARAAVRAGATGVTLLGPPPALGPELAAVGSARGRVNGWLSGPALRPLTLRAVSDVARALPETPVIASGGVRSGDDAIQMLLAGAWAVQVGTIVLVDPTAPVSIARRIAGYLESQRLTWPGALGGRALPSDASRTSGAPA